MPQLIALGLVGVLGYYCWKTLKKEMSRVSEKVREAEASVKDKTKKSDVPTLKKDPETGIYKLDHDD